MARLARRGQQRAADPGLHVFKGHIAGLLRKKRKAGPQGFLKAVHQRFNGQRDCGYAQVVGQTAGIGERSCAAVRRRHQHAGDVVGAQSFHRDAADQGRIHAPGQTHNHPLGPALAHKITGAQGQRAPAGFLRIFAERLGLRGPLRGVYHQHVFLKSFASGQQLSGGIKGQALSVVDAAVIAAHQIDGKKMHMMPLPPQREHLLPGFLRAHAERRGRHVHNGRPPRAGPVP